MIRLCFFTKNLINRRMNFLAHLFLTHDDESLLIGNFIGDHVRNHELPQYPVGVQQGVWLHRRIDTFTDNHPAVRECLKLLRASHGKYAGVVWDVLSDALLSHNWDRFHDVSLEVFTARMYAILERNLHHVPEALRKRVPLMIADNWLMQYAREEGIEFTFSRLQLRASQPEWLNGTTESLRLHYAALEEGFLQFFPELMTHIATLRSEMKA